MFEQTVGPLMVRSLRCRYVLCEWDLRQATLPSLGLVLLQMAAERLAGHTLSTVWHVLPYSPDTHFVIISSFRLFILYFSLHKGKARAFSFCYVTGH
jgi:hypothetical protein